LGLNNKKRSVANPHKLPAKNLSMLKKTNRNVKEKHNSLELPKWVEFINKVLGEIENEKKKAERRTV